MRSIRKRKQYIWITTASQDDSHIQQITVYTKPERHKVTVSNTSGTPHELPVGIVAEYSRYFISYDRDFNPKEGDLIFVDKVPELDVNGYLAINPETNKVYTEPDYVLSHIMNTAKGTIARYGIKKVAGDE